VGAILELCSPFLKRHNSSFLVAMASKRKISNLNAQSKVNDVKIQSIINLIFTPLEHKTELEIEQNIGEN